MGSNLNFFYIFISVKTTQSTNFALSMIRQGAEKFDVVMADMNMPGTDGFAFLKKTKDIPIICELQLSLRLWLVCHRSYEYLDILIVY